MTVPRQPTTAPALETWFIKGALCCCGHPQISRPLSRRHFLWLLAGSAAACASPVIRTPTQEVAQFPLIDAHSHFLSDALYRSAGYEGWVLERAKKYYSPEKLIEVMDRAGIPRMILLGWGSTEIPDMVRRYPTRFIASYCGDLTFRHRPEYGDGTSSVVVEAVTAEFEAALKTGLYRGLGEVHTIALPTSIGGTGAERVSGSPIPPNAPLILRLIDLAGRSQVPINIHCEATHLQAMVAAVRSNPRATVIWAHAGSHGEAMSPIPCTESV